jgi:hypothetical protein
MFLEAKYGLHKVVSFSAATVFTGTMLQDSLPTPCRSIYHVKE